MKACIKEKKHQAIIDYLQLNYKFGAVVIFYEGTAPYSLEADILAIGNDVTLIDILGSLPKVPENNRLAIVLYTKRAIEVAQDYQVRYIFVPKEVPVLAKSAEAIIFLDEHMDSQTVTKGYLNILLYLVFRIDNLAHYTQSFFSPLPELNSFLDILINKNQKISNPTMLLEKFYSEVDMTYQRGDFFDNLESIFAKLPADICFLVCYLVLSAEYVFTKNDINDKLLLTDDRYFFRKHYISLNPSRIGTTSSHINPWIGETKRNHLTRDILSNIVQAYRKLSGKMDLDIDKTAVREILKTALAYSKTDGYITKIAKILTLYF